MHNQKVNISWITSFDNKHLELILFITEQCNFKCSYCYENFKLGKMDPDVLVGIKNIIIKRISKLKELYLSFFGGEPLLNKTAVLELSEWCSQFCKKHNVKYLSGITTNGYLLDKKTFEELVKNGITSFQITLDGEKQIHDKFRPTLDGKSTFDEIYSNIIKMADTNHNFACTLRLNIADSNFNSIKSLIDNYSTPFLNDKRFSFHLHPIFGMSEHILTKGQQLKALKELAEMKGFRCNTPSEYHLCYAGKANSFVIRADGRIHKCTVALESEINNLGRIDKSGAFDIDENKFKKWIFAYDKGCPMLSLSCE